MGESLAENSVTKSTNGRTETHLLMKGQLAGALPNYAYHFNLIFCYFRWSTI